MIRLRFNARKIILYAAGARHRDLTWQWKYRVATPGGSDEQTLEDCQ